MDVKSKKTTATQSKMEKKIILSSLSQLFAKERKKKELIAVSDKSTQQEVLETLDTNGILSAPVRNSEGAFIAFVNKIDILTPILFAPKAKGASSEKDVEWPKLDDDVSALLKISPETSSESSGLVPFVFEESDVLPQLLTAFSSGFHRILVQGPKSVRVVSQSDVITFLDKNIDRLVSFKDEPVASFFKTSVKAIPADATAYTAFREILIQKVVAAPIVDKDGKLVGTISLSDTHGLNKGTYKDLFLPVLDYLKKQGTRRLVTVDKKDTFATVISKLSLNHLHRVWVIEDDKVIGVVSLTDICLFVFSSSAVDKYYGDYLSLLKKQVNLLKVPLSELISEKKALIVSNTTSQKEVLDLLAKNKFLAVPVKDKDDIIGIATLLDIFSVLVLEKSIQDKGDKITKDDLVTAFEQNGKQNIEATIFSRESVNFLIFDEKERLAKVMESFSQGYHRLLVNSTSDPSTYKIFTQSDMISYLSTVITKLGTSMKLKVDQIVKCDGKLTTIQATQSALSAFRALTTKSLIAGPVVNGAGVVIGTLSISDLRGLTSEGVPDLLLTVEEFLKKVHDNKIPAPITVTKTETLSVIIPLIAKTRVHRVWVVSDDGKPLGVLSLTDILMALFLDKLSVE